MLGTGENDDRRRGDAGAVRPGEASAGGRAGDRLARQREALAVVVEDSIDDGLETIRDGAVDCVVGEHRLADDDGLQLLSAVRETAPELPFVLFPADGNGERGSPAHLAGTDPAGPGIDGCPGPTSGMRGSTREALLWGAIGVGSYVVAGALLLVAVAGFWTPDGLDPGASTSLHLLAVGASLALFAAGGYCTSRVRATVGPPDSELPDRFRRGVDPPDDRAGRLSAGRSGLDRDDQSGAGGGPRADPGRDVRPEPVPTDEGADASAVPCPHCGVENDPGYTFCANCSGRLGG